MQGAGSAVAATKAPKAAKAASGVPAKETSDMEMFAKAKLVVGLVKQIEEVANSDKLYRFVEANITLIDAGQKCPS